MSVVNPIGTGPADCSQLTEIRHAKLSFAHGKNGLQFFYVGKIKSKPGNDINSYIRDITSHSAELKGDPCKGGTGVGVIDRSPLDLNSAGPCYFVLELDDQHNWQFQHDHDAVSTKSDYSKSYAELHHIRPGSGAGPGEGCKLIYFAAIDPPSGKKPGMHPFNFHVEFLQDGGKRLPIIIDPDIRYPGGNAP